jgi:hypothetical protein
MDVVVESNVEPRKEWSAPELKKVDVDEITAFGGTTGKDLFSRS